MQIGHERFLQPRIGIVLLLIDIARQITFWITDNTMILKIRDLRLIIINFILLCKLYSYSFDTSTYWDITRFHGTVDRGWLKI